MADNRAMNILRILRKTFTMPKWTESTDDPFKTLIVTIISQNTAHRNTERAFERLSNKFKITPEALAKAETAQIEESLKVAGMYRNKAQAIREVSKRVLEKHGGNLGAILSLPLGRARDKLLKLPGVGPKTADVVLLFCAGMPTIPVDTHVNRVSKRLGFAPKTGGYEAVRTALQSVYNPKDYLAVHILFILHGRRFCKARLPLCKICQVKTFCPSRSLWEKND